MPLETVADFIAAAHAAAAESLAFYDANNGAPNNPYRYANYTATIMDDTLSLIAEAYETKSGARGVRFFYARMNCSSSARKDGDSRTRLSRAQAADFLASTDKFGWRA